MEIYHERCAWPLSCRLAYGALIVGMPLIAVISGDPIGVWVFGGVSLLLAIVGYRLAWVEFRIGEEGVEYGFRGLRNFVPWSRIHALEAETYPLRYLGWGYRIGGRRDRAYSVIGPRRGVRLRFEDEQGKEWSIFLSSRTPEAAVEAANRKLS